MGKLFLDGSLVLKIDSEENKLTNPWAEEMREYYQRNYGSGFDYAYTYPAMAKAVQAAGRVIRSETDRGIIVLMDSRFTHPSYTRTMPTDWFQKSATELVSTGILKEVSDFWSADVKELDL